MAMSFEDMCEACPANTCFSIENISKDEINDLISFLPEWAREQPNLSIILSTTNHSPICLRFNNKGEYCGWIDGKSYSSCATVYARNLVRDKYAWQDLVSEPIHFDIMSVL